jgi:replicative DNA helicase
MIFSQARPEHFGDPSLRHVFEAARELWSTRRPVDPVTVLGAAGDEYGPLLADCMRITPTTTNTEIYLGMIRDAAKLNAIQTAALAISTSRDLDEASAAYEELGAKLRDMDRHSDMTLEELIGRWCDRMQAKEAPDYFNFGIDQLDRLLNVGRGKFVLLAADSSVGKTALALQFAYHMAEAGKKVGFFSLETDADTLADRLLAEVQTAAVALPRSKRRELRDEDFKAVARLALRQAAKKMRVLNDFRSVAEIRARTIMRGFDVIFIDYVQLMEAAGRERWDIVTNISIGLHRMAQELGVTVIGLSQITPASKDQKRAPSKDDLRESRQLKHDADVILIMSISAVGSGMFRELQVAKNKDGPLGRLLLDFDAEHMTFKYRPPDTASDVGKQLRAEGRRVKRRAVDGQAEFRELPEGEGGDLPF